MDEECRKRIYSEDYLDYLVEYFPEETGKNNLTECYVWASNRFAVLYRKGKEYASSERNGIEMRRGGSRD